MSESSSTDQRNQHAEPVGKSTVPLLDDKGSISFSWLQRLDMTPFDFPYIDRLLSSAYSNWLQQNIETTWINDCQAAVFNYTGTRIAGQEEDDVDDQAMIELLSASMKMSVRERQLPDGRLADVYMVPVFCRSNRDMFASLRFTVAREKDHPGREALAAAALHFRACFYSEFEYIFMEDLLDEQNQAGREARHRSILFQIVKRMHDKIDVDAVFDEVFFSIAYLFPHVRITLYMSQDRLTRNPLVKVLLLHQREEVCVSAFTEGRLVVKASESESQPMEIGIPLRGKQGVYGVFHIILPADQEAMTKVDVELITMMADTAGTAFENAKLLEQSNLLIHELRLINELAQRLNQSLQLTEIFEFAVQELLDIFDADYCCILQLDDETNLFKVMSSNVNDFDQESFASDYGFAGEVRRTGEPVILSDYKLNSKVSSKFMDVTRSQSLMAVPMSVNGETKSAILLTHRKPQFFSYDNYKLLQMLAPHIGLAVANASLHAEVRRLANMDNLTGLHVRHYIDKVIQQHQKKDFCGSLILVDIDQFKQVNDTYGHQTGDHILKRVSDIVCSSVRDEDVCARWGGEELAIYLPQLGVQQALVFAEKIRICVEEETEPTVTVSSGIAEWNWLDNDISIESLFYRADMALYEAKNEGRNRIVVDHVKLV